MLGRAAIVEPTVDPGTAGRYQTVSAITGTSPGGTQTSNIVSLVASRAFNSFGCVISLADSSLNRLLFFDAPCPPGYSGMDYWRRGIPSQGNDAGNAVPFSVKEPGTIPAAAVLAGEAEDHVAGPG